MDWWNDLTDWISSDDGWRVISGAIIPFVAIVVAGIVAALIGRGATKRVVSLQEREARNAAVTAIVSAARKAAAWGSLGHDERAYADHLAEDADIRLRLLPVTGAPLAANWTQHEIADIKKNSSTFSFQAEQSLAEFRDRLLEWQARPNRARKLFKNDLERWKFDSPDPDAELITRQQEWNADQAGRSGGGDAASATSSEARPTPTTTSLRPAPQRPAGTTASATPAPSVTPAASGAASAPAGTSSGAGTSTGSGSSGSASASNTTRAYGEGATTPLASAAPVRPALGSPTSPSRESSQGENKTGAGAAGAGAAATGAGTAGTAGTGTADAGKSGAGRSGAGKWDADRPRTDRADDDNADAVDDSKATSANRSSGDAPVPLPVATPTSADAHVNRGTDNRSSGTAHAVAAPGTTNTTSIPTRIANAPAEPADANETSEAPYTQPISASELRRRAADDDE